MYSAGKPLVITDDLLLSDSSQTVSISSFRNSIEDALSLILSILPIPTPFYPKVPDHTADNIHVLHLDTHVLDIY